MIQVRCPQCNAALSLKQTPASGKIKCPKCAAIVNVAASPAAAKVPAAATQPTQRAVAPAARPAAQQARPAAQQARPAAQQARPAQAPSANAGFDDIDFRSIPVPMAPTSSGYFPVAGDARVYDGPIALDPIPVQKTGEEDDDDDGAFNGGAAGPTQKAKQAKVIGIIAGVGVLLIGGGIGAFVLMGGGGSDGSQAVDVVAAAAAAAPSGYQAKSLHNCVVLMPAGSWEEGKIPSAIDSEVIRSEATGSVFLLAAMDGGSQPIDNTQMRKKASRSLGGDILGGTDTERNGYKGIKGVLDQSVFLPRMSVEVFHHDGRFVIIGHASASEMRAASGGEATVAGGGPDEQKEAETFYNSFKIGPPKTGFFGN